MFAKFFEMWLRWMVFEVVQLIAVPSRARPISSQWLRTLHHGSRDAAGILLRSVVSHVGVPAMTPAAPNATLSRCILVIAGRTKSAEQAAEQAVLMR